MTDQPSPELRQASIVERLRTFEEGPGGCWSDDLACRPLLQEAAEEIERLRAALRPFAEIAWRLEWDKITEDDIRGWNEHVVEAPAPDIAPDAYYCLMVSAFVNAASLLGERR